MQELNTTFHPINFETWERRQYFYYFTKMLPTGYSLTVEIDITETRKAAKERGIPFMAAYLYVVSRQLSAQPEMRISTLDNQLGTFDVLHPSYAVFHDNDKTISNMWTEYSPSFISFLAQYLNDRTLYTENHGPSAKPIAPPPNLCMVGMLPWVSFTHYSPVPYQQSDCYFPVIEAGKFFEQNGRTLMPLSVMAQHAVADGYHTSILFNGIQAAFLSPQEWIDQ